MYQLVADALRNSSLPAPMQPSTIDFFHAAKTEIDLPGFLAEHGWHAVQGSDCRLNRLVDGPAGKLIIHRVTTTRHWVWTDIADRHRTGSIVDACIVLLGLKGGQIYGELRRAFRSPPPPLPLAGRGTATATPTSTVTVARPPRFLRPLNEQGYLLLTVTRCIAPWAVEAFAHRLRCTASGHLIGPHNNDGDGEEYRLQTDGSTLKHFHGSLDDGAGRGRSIYHARPKPSEPTAFFLVAESLPDAIAAWSKLDVRTRASSQISSTAGSLSQQGKAKLARLIQRAQEECVRVYGCKLTLLDASDLGEATTTAREGILAAIASSQGAAYERLAPVGYKDWNEVVIAERCVQEIQATADAATEEVHTDSLPDLSGHTLLRGCRGRR